MLSTLLLAALALAAPQNESEELTQWVQSRDERMTWWRDARFGMFVHWGLYSPAGGIWDGKRYEQHYAEWIQNWASVPCTEYARQMKPLFQPEPGFADAWAELAKDAGMRYAVMTSKHHDGFTLFNSKEPYSLANDVAGGTNISPAGRDVAREFADAMRARGLKAGFYYSLLDWQHPDAYEMALPGYPKDGHARDHGRYKAYMRGHVNELLTNYGPLSTIWFDYSDPTHQGDAWGAAQLLSDMRTKQPEILVNNRLYFGLENKNGDYGTPEKYVPPTGLPGMDWEVNHTLNESYGFSSHDVGWKDTATVVRLLCDVVSKGGNLLLNIGPDATGRVPEAAQKTLRSVGAWIKVNGEAIYGTTASPFTRLSWGRATQKPGTLYLMVFDWHPDGVFWLPIRNRITTVDVLGSDAKCSFVCDEGGGGAALTLPLPVDPACTVVRIRYEGALEPLPFAVQPSAGGALVLLPHDASLQGSSLQDSSLQGSSLQGSSLQGSSLQGSSLKVEQVGVIGDVTYNIGYWLDREAFPSWPVRVVGVPLGSVQPVRFGVTLVYACDNGSAGSGFRVEAGNARLDSVTVGTGGWQQYREVFLGSLDLVPGIQEIRVKAVTKPGEAVMNIREIRLEPRVR